VSVHYASSDGSAIAGTDYTAVSGTLSWADGDTADKTIPIPLLANPSAGGSRTMSVTLSSPAFGSVGAPSSHTLTIVDVASAPAGALDVDGNGQYDALTDGLLALRWLFGLGGTTLTNGVVGAGASRPTALEIGPYLAGLGSQLDVDGNGTVDALTDGLLIVRYLFGLRGAALTTGAIGSGATRNAMQIETYLSGLTP
jgi:hypothetical protein